MPNSILNSKTVMAIVESANYNPEDREFLYKLQEIQQKCLHKMRKSVKAREIQNARKAYNLATFYLVKDFSLDEELMYSKAEIKQLAVFEIGLLHRNCCKAEPTMAQSCATPSELRVFVASVIENTAKYLGFECKLLASIKQKEREFNENIADLPGYRSLATALLAGSKGLPS